MVDLAISSKILKSLRLPCLAHLRGSQRSSRSVRGGQNLSWRTENPILGGSKRSWEAQSGPGRPISGQIGHGRTGKSVLGGSKRSWEVKIRSERSFSGSERVKSGLRGSNRVRGPQTRRGRTKISIQGGQIGSWRPISGLGRLRRVWEDCNFGPRDSFPASGGSDRVLGL